VTVEQFHLVSKANYSTISIWVEIFVKKNARVPRGGSQVAELLQAFEHKREIPEFTAYQPMEWIVLHDYPTCGHAWNVGLEQAQGECILLAADDQEPHPGALEAGLRILDQGLLPSARILNSDGSLQSCGPDADEHESGYPSNVARIPFITREMIDCFFPVPQTQYMGDYFITQRCLDAGWPCVVERDFLFTHSFAMEGRIDTLDADVKIFKASV